MLFSKAGKVVRFSEDKVRAMGRTAAGVRGMKLADDDQVVSLIVPSNEGDILTVTQNGYGKRTELAEYPTKVVQLRALCLSRFLSVMVQ